MKPSDPDSSAAEPGRYQSLNLHAEGGIGSVFVARDAQLNRLVALKEIQPRFVDDHESRDRFLREAEVTASLEHPGIVPVYGLGRHADGRPYYAMRMIQGKSLREAIADLHQGRSVDRRAFDLELRRLLNRFTAICETIEYAHSRGVLHRDLKPDNIMLGPFGETLVVDWGLAKLLAARPDPLRFPHCGNHSSEIETISCSAPRRSAAILGGDGTTQAGALIGTPAYMSPEQALGWHDSLTPASDVYSLGATLYTLLTGRAPDVGQELSQLLVRVHTGQFPRPRELNPAIAPALEAICLKGMAGSTSARYQSAAELARDLESYMVDAPVTAWVEPLRVRVARWMRRHHTFVVSAAGVAAVAIVALAAIVVLQKTANEKLALSRDKELRNFQLARDAVDRYFTQVSDDPRLAAAALEPLRRDLIGTAGDFYERFVQQESADPELPYELGWARFRLASIVQEIGSAEEAVKQLEQASLTFLRASQSSNSAGNREGLLFCRLNLVDLYDRTGRSKEAEASLDTALDLARRLVAEFPESAPFQNHLARCFAVQARRSVNNEDLLAAETAYGEELRARERLSQLEPRGAVYQHDLATLHRNLAVLDQRRERLDDARKQLDRSQQIERELIRGTPDDAALIDSLARTVTLLGDLEMRNGDTDRARRAFGEAIELRSQLVKRHPDVLNYRAELAKASNHLGSYHYERGDLELADACFRRAVASAERLAEDYPDEARYQTLLAVSSANWGRLYAATNRFPMAEQLLGRAQQIRQGLLRDHADDLEQASALADVWRELAAVERQTGRTAEAETHLRAALDAFSTLVAKDPATPKHQELVSVCRRELADLLRETERDDEALADYGQARERQRQLVATHPAVVAYRTSLATTCVQLGRLLLDRAQADESLASFREAIELLAAQERQSLSVDSQTTLGNAHAGSALALEQTNQLDEAITELDRAIALSSPANTMGLRLKRATLYAATGRMDAAVADADSLVNEAAGYGPALFELARIHAAGANAAQQDASLNDSQQATLVELRGQKAVELLEAARRTGFFRDVANRARLNDSPFKNLASPSDAYRNLLEVLESEHAARD